MIGTGDWSPLLVHLFVLLICTGGFYTLIITGAMKWLRIKKLRKYGWFFVFVATIILMIGLGVITLVIGSYILGASSATSFSIGVFLAALITTFIVAIQTPRKAR